MLKFRLPQWQSCMTILSIIIVTTNIIFIVIINIVIIIITIIIIIVKNSAYSLTYTLKNKRS